MKRRLTIISIIVIMLVQTINPAGFGLSKVNAAAEGASLDLLITRSIDKQVYNQGDTAKLIYSITPVGSLQSPVQSASDIVIALDISKGMSGRKLSAAKVAAVDFIDKIKAADTGNKIGFVAFGYKTNIALELTADLDSVAEHIDGIDEKNLMSGSNFQDALERCRTILQEGTAENKYVVFISDGEPNYFTSAYRSKKYENRYAIKEDNLYYYTNYPMKTQMAYNKALDSSRKLAADGIVLYSVGIGSSFDIDMSFLRQLSKATGGAAYHAELPDSVISILTKISGNIMDAKLSGLVIRDKLPSGIDIISNESVVKDEKGNISIVLPDIIYTSDGKTPPPFNYVLELSLNEAGSYTLNDAKIEYRDIDSKKKSKSINGISFTVKPGSGGPGLTVSKSISDTELTEGETAILSYTVTPRGSYDAGEVRKPLDIVLLIDKSNGMEDNGKLVKAKEAAESFVNVFRKAGQGDRISLVTFNRYSKIEEALTTDYEAVINSIKEIAADDGYSFDSGTNIEIGLKAAENALKGSTRTKYVIMLSDGIPTYYTASIDKNDYVDYYEYIPIWPFEGYWIYPVKYSHWYKEPSNVIFEGDSMQDYNLQFGEYSYKQVSGRRSYNDAREQAESLKDKGIILNTVCLTQGPEIDPDFMEELAELGEGTAYTSETSEDLKRVFEEMAKELTYQTLSNIKITELLPQSVDVTADEYITVDGRTVTLSIPDIVYEKGKGTPSPITVSIQLRFDKEGLYELSEISRLEYINWDDKAAEPVNMDKITVTVTKGHSEPIDAQIRAIDGKSEVSVINKGKFDALVSFEVLNAGRLNLRIYAAEGSEEFFEALNAVSDITDADGNAYKVTKSADGFYLTTDKPLQSGAYTAKIKFSLDSIPQGTYFLLLDTGTAAAHQRLQIDVVAMPILL